MIDWAIMTLNDASALTLLAAVLIQARADLRRPAHADDARRTLLHFGLPPEPLTDTEKCTAIRRLLLQNKGVVDPMTTTNTPADFRHLAAAAGAAANNIDAATTRRARALAALKRTDGAPLYGEQETAERTEAIDEEYAGALAAAEAIARSAAETIARSTGADADPLWTLAGADLARVESLARLAEQDAGALPVTEIAPRILAAARSGDPAVILAFNRARAAFESRSAAEQEKRAILAALVELRSAADALKPTPPTGARDASRAIDALWTRLGRARLDMQPVRLPSPF